MSIKKRRKYLRTIGTDSIRSMGQEPPNVETNGAQLPQYSPYANGSLLDLEVVIINKTAEKKI